jgi:hypothetical protein
MHYKNKEDSTDYNKKYLPVHGIIGLLLIIISWYLNWNLKGPRTNWGFFPLWLGYCLTIDAIVFYRKGDSLLKRNFNSYILLFIISAPAWWLFELFNLRMQNWDYKGKEYFTYLQFFLYATLSFSTVMPAVFGTAELVSTFKWIKKLKAKGEKIPQRKTTNTIFLSGVIILILILVFPDYFFFLIWIALYFVLDPINVWLKNRNLISYFVNNDWRPLLTLGIGCLICGFFWEMWNYYSYPKWVYHLPFADFFHVFEMPVLGYTGYIPFSLELFALHHLITGFFKKAENNYIKIL